MSYIEIICVFLLLGLGSKYNPLGVNPLIIVGMIGLVACNIVFGVRYYRTVYIRLMIKRERFVKINMLVKEKKTVNEVKNNNKQ